MLHDIIGRSDCGARLPDSRRLAFGALALVLCLGPEPGFAQPGASLEALDRELASLGQELERAGRDGETVGRLLDVARRRQALLAELVERDPGRVLSLALPAEVRQRFPSAVQARLEEQVELEGDVTVLYEDHGGHARLRHFLGTGGRRRSLHFSEPPPDLRTGDRLRVRGVELPRPGPTGSDAVVAYCCGAEGVLALAGGNGRKKGQGGDASEPPPPTSAMGERRVLTILVNFADAPVEPYPPSEAESLVFGATDGFIQETSYGQTWLVGDVAGWFTISASSTECDLFAIAGQARSAASGAGFDPAAYDHLIYSFPRGGCTGVGLGTVGGSPSEAWILGNPGLKVLSHELGHNLGLHHARALDCGDAVLGTSCAVFEYGDRIDTMGNVEAGHYNAFHKDLLGWFDTGAAPVVTEVRASGLYTLQPIELGGTGPGALAIPRPVDPTTGEGDWYYLEYRRPIGFDAFLVDNANVSGGIVVHTGSPTNANSSLQLDMTPGSGLQNWSDWSDPALPVGASFRDPEAGVTITTVSAGGAVAEVSVSFDADPIGAGGSSSGWQIAATSDRAVYGWKDTAELSALVTADGSPLVGATVSFRVSDPTGQTVLRSAVTGGDGVAVVQQRFRRRDPPGEYRVHAEATAEAGPGAETWTGFVLD